MRTSHSTRTRDGKVTDETLTIYSDLGVLEKVKEIVAQKFSEDAARTVRWVKLEIRFAGVTPESSVIVKFGRYQGVEE